MVGKLLQVVGVVAVLAIGGAGIAALAVVKDRVRVVVTDDGVATADPTALLRDDLRALRQDLDALTKALDTNVGQLASALEQRAAERQALVLERLTALDELRRAAAEAALRLQALEGRVQQLGEAAANAPTPAVADAPPVAPAAHAAEVATPVAPTAAAAAAQAPAPAAKPPAGASFLSFQLPSRTFAFDRLQRFEVVPELSRVGFDAKSTLHDFSGVTQKVSGDWRGNLADPAGAWTGAIRCEAASLVTGVDGRDAAMREHLDVAKHAQIEFAIERFEPAADGIDAANRSVRGDVVGTMTIRGVAKPLRMPVQIHVDESRRVVVEGQQRLRLPDFEVPVPSQLGLINMQEEVGIWIALRARVVAGGADAR